MKGKFKKDLVIILKGFIIGSSMSVPGVSGGTMAILLGIYDKLIGAISNFLKDIKGNTILSLKILHRFRRWNRFLSLCHQMAIGKISVTGFVLFPGSGNWRNTCFI